MKADLKSWVREEEPEDLHRFRVQVKKLRAFLILSDSVENHPKLTQYFKPVRRVFKQAGEIRNAYINQQLAKAQQIDDNELISSQHKLQVEASRRFKSKTVKFLGKLRDAHRVLKEKIKRISNLHVRLFYQNQLKQIAAVLAEVPFTEHLHECRKQIKILIYNHKLAYTALGTGFNRDYLDQVQTAIGNWHDHVLAINLFLNSEVNNKTALIQLKKEDVLLKSNIADLVKDFYNRATTVMDLTVEQLS